MTKAQVQCDRCLTIAAIEYNEEVVPKIYVDMVLNGMLIRHECRPISEIPVTVGFEKAES